MITPEKQQAIWELYQAGVKLRRISKDLNVDRKTVSKIIKNKGHLPITQRDDSIKIDQELLENLYRKCDGWKQRVHEELVALGHNIAYSTLTKKLRELGIGEEKNERCERVPDKPGEEFQHDTSPYTLKIGDKRIKVQASVMYLRYSKLRYLKFYRSFTRFHMKCFFHEALSHFGYCAKQCVIDNTNLAVLSGTGKNAIMVPEMVHFARQFGFKFLAHEKGHANRKAGEERSFWFVETNFLPGRTFRTLEDLNEQAFTWATVKIAKRPLSKTKLIPIELFEYEKSYLNKIPSFVQPPYLQIQRLIDPYGYVSFDGNYFWIPGVKAKFNVTVFRFCNSIKVYDKRELLIEYQLPSSETHNEIFKPDGMEQKLRQPNNRKFPTKEEEKRLRQCDPVVDEYLTFIIKIKTNPCQKHKFIRELFGLYHRTALIIFTKAVARALKYRVDDTSTIERICSILLKENVFETTHAEVNGDFFNRESYQEGFLTEEPDFSVYENMNNEHEGQEDE
jgi:hypothetical protein